MDRPGFTTAAHAAAHAAEFRKSAVLHYPPLWVTLGICSPCPNRCDFCAYHCPDGRKISKVFNVRFSLPLEEARRLIDFFHRGGVPKIHVCATGEPLWHPEFFPILDHVIRRYGTVSFQSSFPRALVEARDAIRKLRDRRGKISRITVDLMGNRAVKGNDGHALYATLAQISRGGEQPISANFLLTRTNWRDLETVVRSLHAWKLPIPLQAVRVFPHAMNAFTDAGNAWDREHLTPGEEAGLAEIVRLARSLGVRLWVPDPDARGRCDVFWTKLQVWPTRGSAPGRHDNLVPHGCNAVVLGDMASLGYVFDFPDVLSLWNSPALVRIRRSLLAGIAPDAHCRHCPQNGAEGKHA